MLTNANEDGFIYKFYLLLVQDQNGWTPSEDLVFVSYPYSLTIALYEAPIIY